MKFRKKEIFLCCLSKVVCGCLFRIRIWHVIFKDERRERTPNCFLPLSFTQVRRVECVKERDKKSFVLYLWSFSRSTCSTLWSFVLYSFSSLPFSIPLHLCVINFFRVDYKKHRSERKRTNLRNFYFKKWMMLIFLSKMFTVREILTLFWDPRFWLPPGEKWEFLDPTDEFDYADYRDLYMYPIAIGVGILVFRLGLDK